MKKNTIPVCDIPELTIGLDLSDRTFRFCELNAKGEIVGEGQRKLGSRESEKISGGAAQGTRGAGNRRAIGMGPAAGGTVRAPSGSGECAGVASGHRAESPQRFSRRAATGAAGACGCATAESGPAPQRAAAGRSVCGACAGRAGGGAHHADQLRARDHQDHRTPVAGSFHASLFRTRPPGRAGSVAARAWAAAQRAGTDGGGTEPL